MLFIPDRRFILAVAELDRLVTGSASNEISLAFQDDRWRVTYETRKVGTLPAVPSFDDALQFVAVCVECVFRRLLLLLGTFAT